MAFDIYTQVTDNIIAAIEAGISDGWRMPWHRAAGAQSAPRNATTAKPYQGMNTVILWSAAARYGYSSPIWATYKQWQSIGAQVRKGEKSVICVKWGTFRPRDTAADDGDDSNPQRKRLYAMPFFLFNVAQCDNVPAHLTAPAAPQPQPVNPVTALQHVDDAISATGATIRHGGGGAYYSPSDDYVQMPPRETFIATPTRSATEGYYGVLLHELTHWTGHSSRCARDFRGRFGDEHYAAEELVAELGAAFLCAELGVTAETAPDHAQYIRSWLKVLRNDKRAIFTASAAAQRAANFVMAFSRKADDADEQIAA